MKVKHFGQIVDIEPRQAALENSIARYLRRLGSMKQKALWIRVRGRGIAVEEFQSAIDSMVERGLLVRETTNYVNSFILKLAAEK